MNQQLFHKAAFDLHTFKMKLQENKLLYISTFELQQATLNPLTLELNLFRRN